MVAAPIEAMNAIIEMHDMVRRSVDQRRLYTFSIDDDRDVTHRYDDGPAGAAQAAASPPISRRRDQSRR